MNDSFRNLIRDVVKHVLTNNGCTFESVLKHFGEPVELTARAVLKAAELKLLNDGRHAYQRVKGRVVKHRVNDLLWINTNTTDFLTGEFDPFAKPRETAILLDETDVAILRYLNESPGVAKSQEDIAAGAEADRKTVGICLDKLRDADYVAHPAGKKRKDAITAAGIERLSLVDGVP